MVIVRTFLAIAASNTRPIYHVDANNAILHGDLNEEVYMDLRLGYIIRILLLWFVGSQNPCMASNEASRQSFSKLTSVLLAIGYVHFTAVLVYVDDILVTGTNASHITALKLFLDNNFNIKDFGLIKYYLGIEVLHTKAGLFLNQRKYALDLIQNVGLLEAKPLSIPMDTNKRRNQMRVIYWKMLPFIEELLAS